METKQCSKCKKVKAIDQFGDRGDGYTTKRAQCKECDLLRYAQYRKVNHEKCKQSAVDYHRRNKQKCLDIANAYHETLPGKMAMWKTGAKRRDINWDLNLSNLEAMPMICHYTGEQLTLERNKPNTISLDRLNSSKGYTKDNVVFCCAHINVMKWETGDKEFLNWCRKVVKHLDK